MLLKALRCAPPKLNSWTAALSGGDDLAITYMFISHITVPSNDNANALEEMGQPHLYSNYTQPKSRYISSNNSAEHW